MSPVTTARWILILGLSFVFIYFGIDKFVDASLWIGWIPDWMNGLLGMNSSLWLQIIGVTEIVIGIALLIPVRLLRQIATIAAALHLVGILTQVGWNDVGVRDIGLLMMTLALWFLL